MAEKFATPQQAKPQQHVIPLRDWTALDHLTHDFANDPGYRQRCLERHGQHMTQDGRRVTA